MSGTSKHEKTEKAKRNRVSHSDRLNEKRLNAQLHSKNFDFQQDE